MQDWSAIETEEDFKQKIKGSLEAEIKEILKSDFESAVGMSRKWDAREAGREVARSTLKKLKTPPSFFLLFSTIHYKKHGGFQEFLDGVWDVLPDKTPLIGGTVAGFINSDGSYARGATAMAVSSPNMDAAIGFGKNPKKSPKKAAQRCAAMIKNGLKNSDYQNKFLFEIVSGPKFPTIPFKGEFRIIKNRSLSLLFAYLSKISTSLFQKGAAREAEALQFLSKELDDFYILGGSSMDDCRYVDNFQFYNKKVYKNSLLGLGLQTNLFPIIKSGSGLISTGKKSNVTKDRVWGHIICSLDHKPATDVYLKAVDWPEKILDERVYTKTIYYPLGSIINEKLIVPNVIALFVGKYIVLAHSIPSKKLCLLTTSGERLTKAIDDALFGIPSNFGFGVSCAIRMQTLGDKVNIVKEKLKSKFGDNFLVIYTPGESIYLPDKGICQHFQNTFNILTFGTSKIDLT